MAISNNSYSLLITVKSGNYQSLVSAYHFTTASLLNHNIKLKLVFFYQEAVTILVYPSIYAIWKNMILGSKIPHGICQAACKKRGIEVKAPFKYLSMLEFIKTCEQVDRFIQF